MDAPPQPLRGGARVEEGGGVRPPSYATAPPARPPGLRPYLSPTSPDISSFWKNERNESGIAIIEVFRAKMFELEIMISFKSDQWEAS